MTYSLVPPPIFHCRRSLPALARPRRFFSYYITYTMTATDSFSSGSCPVDHSSFAWVAGRNAPPSANSSSSCPVDHTKFQRRTTEGASPSPDPHTDALNPLNMMPNLSQIPAEGQQHSLSTNRAQSSIPRSDARETWEYPSPQQFYNALKRKGYETPEHEIPTMVDIHNFLNEACWGEVLKWEKIFHCDCKDVKLKKFQGRPKDLTPKARMYSWFGYDEVEYCFAVPVGHLF